ncbi:hypothetical protein WSM22_40300 [Cytophagales bacterium WSM2-2]|nr:hypothetical protein WSM22_40300 [Cytophagales bacterium WSM2-2]
MKLKYTHQLTGFLLLVIFAVACGDDKYQVPKAKREFQDDCIKRSLGPNLVNYRLEFAYAMALPQDMGEIVSAQVEASIPGAVDAVTPTNGTFLEHRAYSTDGGGNDKPVQIADPSSTEGGLTKVTFTRDTFAVTLRYFYKIPPEAKGQNVSFTFSATDSNGKTISMKMGPYAVSSMDMVLDKVVTDNTAMYISIADMAVYTAAQAAAIPDKIDLVYLYRALVQPPAPAAALTFKHALVAPATDPTYLPGVTLPAGVNKNTKMIEVLSLRDQQLARLQYGIFIDDLDFKKLDTSTASNFTINLKNESGAWIETADGQYRAYIYINSVNDASKTMTISMKRLTMF